MKKLIFSVLLVFSFVTVASAGDGYFIQGFSKGWQQGIQNRRARQQHKAQLDLIEAQKKLLEAQTKAIEGGAHKKSKRLVFSGYDWLKLSKDTQFAILSGFLKGYYSGRRDAFWKTLPRDFNSISGGQADEMMVWEEHLKDSKFAGDIGFYQNKIEAFYVTFPLCKKENIWPMLSNFFNIWLNIGSNEKVFTYKEIGDACSKIP